MATVFLLDTNVISAAMKDPTGRIGRKLLSIPQEQLCSSIFVSCELLFGAEKKRSAKLRERVEAMLATISIKGLPSEFEQTYASVRAHMERRGLSISSMDLLIACHALALDATLVTENYREFSQVPELKLESWSL